ncbi:jg23001, partial [Pararge aegeria aegeria]
MDRGHDGPYTGRDGGRSRYFNPVAWIVVTTGRDHDPCNWLRISTNPKSLS